MENILAIITKDDKAIAAMEVMATDAHVIAVGSGSLADAPRIPVNDVRSIYVVTLSETCTFEEWTTSRGYNAPAEQDFKFTVTVTCNTKEQAEQVMAERIGPDEDYGFPYTIYWNASETKQ